MSPGPLVSVIIAYYKQERFIAETVRSVQQQTLLPLGRRSPMHFSRSPPPFFRQCNPLQKVMVSVDLLCCVIRQDIEHRRRLVPPEAIWKQVEAWTSGTICTAMTSNRLYPDHRSSKCRTSGL